MKLLSTITSSRVICADLVHLQDTKIYPFTILTEELKTSVEREAETQKRLEQLRQHMVSKGTAGLRVSANPIKHRNVSPQNAKRYNLVLMDTRTAGNIDECVHGHWEKMYQLGLIKDRPSKGNNLDTDILTIQMYEPWTARNGVPDMPLWAAIKLAGDDPLISDTGVISTKWNDLVKLPWLPICQMPLTVFKALVETNGETFKAPSSEQIVQNYKGTGTPVVKLTKPYEDKQAAGTIKYIMQLDASEKVCSKRNGPARRTSVSAIFMNEETQCDLLLTMLAAEHDHA